MGQRSDVRSVILQGHDRTGKGEKETITTADLHILVFSWSQKHGITWSLFLDCFENIGTLAVQRKGPRWLD